MGNDSGFRHGTNWIQGNTTVGDFAGTVAVGLGGRAELFGALRWGGGLTFPSRNIVRLNAELNGYVPSSDTATITGTTLRATDGSFAPLVSATENITRATVGVTAQARNG